MGWREVGRSRAGVAVLTKKKDEEGKSRALFFEVEREAGVSFFFFSSFFSFSRFDVSSRPPKGHGGGQRCSCCCRRCSCSSSAVETLSRGRQGQVSFWFSFRLG